MFKNIDKPKENDWEDDNHNEKELINTIINISRFLFLIQVITTEMVEHAISGISELKIEGDAFHRCNDCGQILSLSVCGNKLHITGDTVCENNRYYTIDIDFPTGEVVCADWPDRFSEIPNFRKHNFDVNRISGKRKCSEYYAQHNMLHMFVGNTCPSVCFSYDTNRFMIGCDVTCDEDSGDDIENPLFTGFTAIGGICTDLWWTSLIDKVFYDKLIADLLQYHLGVVEDALTNLGADDIFILSGNISFSTNTGAEAKRVLQFLQQLVDKNVN